MGKDVGMLAWNVGSICLEGLLPDCPVSHRPEHSALEENGERGQRNQEQSVRIERKRRLSGCGEPGKVPSKRYDVSRKVGYC